MDFSFIIYSIFFGFSLIVGHYIADYPLQGEFLAKAKNQHTAIPGIPWWHCLAAHATIHGGMVAAMVMLFGILFPVGVSLATVTATALLMAAVEALTHYCIDYAKCDGQIDFSTDQRNHLVMKAVIWGTTVATFVLLAS